MSYDPYIHFQGNCRPAMTRYQQIFGGRLQIMDWAQAPDATDQMRASGLVMHASLNSGGRVLFAGDFPPGMAGDPQAAFSISHTAASIPEARRIFDALAERGTVVMDFAATFWSEGYGMVRDAYGTHWMVAGPERRTEPDGV